MSILKCKMCGGTLDIKEGESIAVCEYCGTKQTVPKVDDDRIANLYDRANHLRRNNEFDKASALYEQILSDRNDDAEAYWNILLCSHGIEYVEDPITHKRIPTVNRAHFDSIFNDSNYQNALKYADDASKEIYKEEAAVIDEIQKRILAISSKEDPFDIFICYKETDSYGRRTMDSVIAQNIYKELTNDGYKVFFSRITLEDKLGTAYEPYIFAALTSARVMIVVGTSRENLEAVWVRNEWSRYLGFIVGGEKKILIPVYQNMNPYDMPEEFAFIQAQDLSKIGGMQDLVYGVEKILNRSTSPVKKESVSSSGIYKRAMMFLEDGDFEKADEYFEKMLDADPEDAKAYIGKLLVELKIKSEDELVNHPEQIINNRYFAKALKFANEKYALYLNNLIKSANNLEKERNLESKYNDLLAVFKNAQDADTYRFVITLADDIGGYKDSASIRKQCEDKIKALNCEHIYKRAKVLFNSKNSSDIQKACELFEQIYDYRDSDDLRKQCSKRIDELNIIQNENSNGSNNNKGKSKFVVVVLALATILTIIFLCIPKSNKSISIKRITREYNIGVCIYEFNDNFMTLYREEIARYFDALSNDEVKYNVEIVDGKNDAATQTEQINTFIAKGVDALIVNMVQPSTIEAVEDAAEEAGIPVVFINREPAEAETHQYGANQCYVGAKAQESGTYQGMIVYDLPNHGDLNGNGKVDYVMIMGDVNNTDAQYRTEYSIKYLTDNGVEVNKLLEQTGNWDQTQGQEIAANALSNFGADIDVIFCNNDGMALGAYQSIVAAGRTVGTDIYLLGVDALDECVEMVYNGTMTGTVLNDAVGQATACCDAVVGFLAGEDVETYQYVPYILVTKY